MAVTKVEYDKLVNDPAGTSAKLIRIDTANDFIIVDVITGGISGDDPEAKIRQEIFRSDLRRFWLKIERNSVITLLFAKPSTLPTQPKPVRNGRARLWAFWIPSCFM